MRKQQTQKFKEREEQRMGRLVNRQRTAEEEQEGLAALENMNLDRRVDDSNMYD